MKIFEIISSKQPWFALLTLFLLDMSILKFIIDTCGSIFAILFIASFKIDLAIMKDATQMVCECLFSSIIDKHLVLRQMTPTLSIGNYSIVSMNLIIVNLSSLLNTLFRKSIYVPTIFR